MRLNTRFIKARKIIAVCVLMILSASCITVGSQVKAAQLDDETLRSYANSNIMFYDSSCIAGGMTSICGKTAKEKYWSALRKYFDEIHAAGIMGNIAYEGAFSPVEWENGKVVNRLNQFTSGYYWDRLYNNCDRCGVGVGAFGLTWDLSKYLHFVNDKAMDLMKYFQNPEKYGFYGDAGRGQKALEAIGGTDFDRLVEIEVGYAVEEFNSSATDRYKKMIFTTPEEAAAWWAINWENCQYCKSARVQNERGAAAKSAYEEFKGFKCSSGGSGRSSAVSISDVSDTSITLVGDSISVYAEKELEEKFPSSYLNMIGSRHSTSAGVCNDNSSGGLGILGQIATGEGSVPKQRNSGECVTVEVDDSSMKDNVVWALGGNTNGATRETILKVVRLVGDRNLFLVTPYNGIERYLPSVGVTIKEFTDNIAKMYREVASEFDNVYIVDWNEAVRNDESTYIISESYAHVHPTDAGKKLWADLIAKAIAEVASCSKDTYKDQSYKERLLNLHSFSQLNGIFKDEMMCNTTGANTISKGGCGVMSLYAAYYMFTGKGLNDITVFKELKSAAEQDGYNVCTASAATRFGEKLESYTGMKSNGAVKYDWDALVTELKSGNKVIILVGASNGSVFTSNGHYMMLDHYDEIKNMMYLFDPAMRARTRVDEYVRSGHVEYYNSGGTDGIYVDKIAMEEIVRPIEAVSISYGGGVDCYNVCPTGGKVEGGLTESQAEALAAYYNSAKVWGFETRDGLRNKKNNCTAFSMWFVDFFTELDANWLGNGGDFAYNLAKRNNLEQGNDPRPFAVFSSTADGVAYAINPSTGRKYGHTGVVVAVNGDKVMTVEAGWPKTAARKVVYDVDKLCKNDHYPTCFTYLDSYVDNSKLTGISRR